MPERPLILFPTPAPASRSTLGGGGGRVRRPSPQRQFERLSPRFEELQKVFAAGKVEIQQTASSKYYEQVLVMEIIGSVENFFSAVKDLKGFEWMGEIEVDEIAPDEDFYDESKPERKLSGRLYLVMTNQKALEQMLSLWQRYNENHDMKFEYGLTKFRDVFQHLKDIRQWDVEDRLRETGVMDIWEDDLAFDAGRIIQFEVELWFRSEKKIRDAIKNRVEGLVNEEGGKILSQSVIGGIAYHGLLAELPAHAIQKIIDDQTTKLVKCEDIMFLRPVGQMVVGDKLPEGDLEITQIEEKPLPSAEPVVALFDGLPLANHSQLVDRLSIDDPDNWEADYLAAERVHGSSMASLIIHGDLNQSEPPLSRSIYVRPIMKPLGPLGSSEPRPERIPDDCLLFVDLIHRAVKRLFDKGEQGEDPVAKQIKVINLSIGDPARQFTHSMSPLARLLDWLSVKYGVLFIVSAGNHSKPISLGASQQEFNSFGADELEAATIKALYEDARNRKLLAPAETINGITVGAIHWDKAQVDHQGDRIDPFGSPLPSPISAFGSGYRRAIKPDVVYYGGRQWYRQPRKPTDPVTIKPVISNSPPGNQVASPGSAAGELNATSYSCGTSNATALMSRAASICYDSLQAIFNVQANAINRKNYEVPLLKAMLVHGCSWGNMGSLISKALQPPKNVRKKLLISRWMGYGVPQIGRVLDCTEQRATLLGYGQLSDGRAHVFKLPLPPSLSSQTKWRRLTITLAWLSPISAKTQKYRDAYLWFEIIKNGFEDLTPEPRDAGRQAAKRGTIQHEIFEGEKALPFNDGDVIEIKVNCRKDAAKFWPPIAYGLAVSLEVAEGVNIAVYNEIKTRIHVHAPTSPIKVERS